MSEEKVRVGLHLTEDESANLKRYAAKSGLSVSAFMRQLCRGCAPQPKPPKEFWELLNSLYEVHKGFQKCSEQESSALEICKEIEQLIVDFQQVFTAPQKINLEKLIEQAVV